MHAAVKLVIILPDLIDLPGKLSPSAKGACPKY